MKHSHRLLFILTLIFLSSCNPLITTNLNKSYPPIDYKQDVVIIGINQTEPDSCEVLGEVKIGDTGFSVNCGYDLAIDKAKLEARKAGGNALKIIDHRLPNPMGSSCHRIKAKILKIKDIENYSQKVEKEILLDVDYAILKVFRYKGVGSLINYNLCLGDSVICRVKNNFKTTLHIKKDGLNTLWAKTEAKSELPINVEMGKTYYLRCGITMGAFVGHPKLELVDPKTGKNEFESFKAKNQ